MLHPNPEYHRQYQADWRERNPERANSHQRASALRKLEQRAGRPCPKLCEACDKPDSTGRRLSFDHDHETGKFRGWLCGSCNNALGRVGDDPARLRALADYLEKGGVEIPLTL